MCQVGRHKLPDEITVERRLQARTIPDKRTIQHCTSYIALEEQGENKTKDNILNTGKDRYSKYGSCGYKRRGDEASAHHIICYKREFQRHY